MLFDPATPRRAWSGRPSRIINCLLLLLAASACTPSTDESAHPDGNGAKDAATREAPEPDVEDSVASLMTFRQQVVIAASDLANRLGVPPDSVTVSNARPVSWRSSALGCPRPDRMYADVLTPGVQILLSVGDDLYAYHAAVGKEPFNCPLDRVEVPVYDEDSDQL